MSHTGRWPRRVAILFILGLLAACGDDGTTAGAGGKFCDAMERVSTLLEPNTGSTAPEGVEARYRELSRQLDQAEQTAPSAIEGDVAIFAAAIDDYATALAGVGYDLDTVYSTPEGVQLAEDTSHALTPAVVDHLTGRCGLDLGPPR